MRLRKTEKKKMCVKVHGSQSMKWTEVAGSLVENGKTWSTSFLDYHDIILLRICRSQIKDMALQKKNLIPDQGRKKNIVE